MFSWQRFLDSQRLEYSDRGGAKGNLYFHCPFCGAADQGQHMGVSLEGPAWGCWRNAAHRGRNPARLIQALLSCPWPEAQRLAQQGSKPFSGASNSQLGAMLEGLAGSGGQKPRPAPKMPEGAKRIRVSDPPRLASDYFRDRRFSGSEAGRLISDFDLFFAMTGDWSYRLILPIRDQDDEMFTYTGRAINEGAKIRYKTLSHDPEKVEKGEPVARGPITDILLDLPRLQFGGQFLILSEGPFDAMRLSLHAREFDARATCLFGKSVSPAQLDLIADLRHQYDRIFLLLDPEASFDAMALSRQLAVLGVNIFYLEGKADPGEMRGEDIRRMMGKMEQVA